LSPPFSRGAGGDRSNFSPLAGGLILAREKCPNESPRP
jgi:hypothetical protein